MPKPNPKRVVIALGSNLGDSSAVIRSAVGLLQGFSPEPVRCSSLWTSTPLDCPPDSPLFVNAVVELQLPPPHTPESFLAILQGLERNFGRTPKKILNEARPLDLDLIHWDGETRSSKALTLPHPRAHLRRFVLEPLSELDPHLQLPGQTQPVTALLARLEDQGELRRLGPLHPFP
jgi:2-amino-4-hydroxy-6-hydroxymethyldihydropteridine diphosphokinase